jgi:DTW domain-containing protein YfiP
MVEDLCVCEVFPSLKLKTRVVTLIHHKEYWKPSNTGHLVRIALENSLVKVRRDPINYVETAHLLQPEAVNLALFPSKDSQELSPKFIRSLKGPINLIVPDGSWRQASKMIVRDPVLRGLPRVFLPASGEPSVYRLRVETREEGLATFEAIARVLGVIEGDDVRDQLEKAFRIFTDRLLWARGRLPLAEAAQSLLGTRHSVLYSKASTPGHE